MERMWRKVNHSFGGRASKTTVAAGHAVVAPGTATMQSTDTVSSAGGFGDGQVVVAVAGLPSSTATGRRLAASGGGVVGAGAVPLPNAPTKSLSQHVLAQSTTSTERRRRRRRKSRPRRSGGGGGGGMTSCVGGGGGDNMSSSGGFYTIKESTGILSGGVGGSSNHRHHRQSHHGGGGGSSTTVSHRLMLMASSAPSGTVMMYPNTRAAHGASNSGTATSGLPCLPLAQTTAGQTMALTAATNSASAAPDISLRQRAVAKLRMFNFHLNWDLHMTHCKPCGPRLSNSGSGGSGGGNIITRRLCRNRRREDNELYRSNSFKFERFERKECIEDLTDTLQKQIAICDDYSLPVDFVKKRPSSFDPNLAESIIPANPENWTVPSPQAEFVAFTEAQQQPQLPSTTAQQQQQQQQQHPPPPLSTLPSAVHATHGFSVGPIGVTNNTLPPLPQQQAHHQQPLQQQQQQQQGQQQVAQTHVIQLKTRNQQQQQLQRPLHQQHTPLPQTTAHIKQASIKLIEGYSDPKDSKQRQQHHKKVYHKKLKGKRRPTAAAAHKKHHQQQQQQLLLQQQQQQQQAEQQQSHQQTVEPLQEQPLPLPPQQQLELPQVKQQQQKPATTVRSSTNNSHFGSSSKDKRSNYSSDSSAPQTSEDEDDNDADAQSLKIPELNSPDSISDDLVRPLPPQLHRSPRKLNVTYAESSKRNPSPYYYSDLLKSKEAPAVTVSAVEETSRPFETPLTAREAKNKSRQSTVSEPPQLTQPSGGPASAFAYRKSTSLDAPNEPAAEVAEEANEFAFELCEAGEFSNNATAIGAPGSLLLGGREDKRYSFTEGGVHIIRCDSPSTSTSEESDCSECQKRREWHARALALVRKTCNVQPLNAAAATGPTNCQQQRDGDETQGVVDGNAASAGGVDGTDCLESMPPHRLLLGPAAVCACVAPSATLGDDLDEYFQPRSIFYVHPHGVHECEDCCTPPPAGKPLSTSRLQNDSKSGNSEDLNGDEIDDEMSGRTRQIYETAFDCKIAKSDDDLDEVERVTNHSVLLQLNNGNLPAAASRRDAEARREEREKAKASSKSRLEGKRLKNCKNQALQEQACNSGGTASSGGSPLTVGLDTTTAGRAGTDTTTMSSGVSALSAELSNVHLHNAPLQLVDQQNNTTTSTSTTTMAATSNSQLPMRGYTPSPPSTAPLPIKFPGKHDRFFMNSIKSAPNLPSSNPAHPRLRDLRLPIQSSLRQQLQQGSSLGTSNETSLTDSAYVNPPSSSSATAHHSSGGGAGVGSSKTRDRPRSFVLESGRVLELRRGHGLSGHHHQSQSQHHHHSHHNHHQHHVGNGSRGRQHNYSSTESIATSSSGGSMESLRSSTSEGNRSTTSSESRHSTSLSSHSSESGSSSVAFPLRAPVVVHSKLHILSPISDKSSQEPASELSGNKTQQATPDGATNTQLTLPQQQQLQAASQQKSSETAPQLHIDALKKRRPAPQNKTLLHLADEILGSDSGISLHSREDGKSLDLQKFTLPKLNFPPKDKNNDSGISAATAGGGGALPQDLRDLPFDMPKLRRRKTQQDACTSGSATSVDLGDLPFDMPKLRRRLRANQADINNLIVHSTESSGISQASSSHSMRDDNKTALKLDSAIFRQNLTLNLNEPRPANKFGSLDLRGMSSTKELNLNLTQGYATAVDLIDVSIPLDRQGWYHGAITRVEAETTLRPLTEGSFLVRNCESTKQDYSLSLKGAKGFMHMRIQRNDAGQYILGQFSRPFETVPDMIRHFCLNRLPVRGAEHMCLIEPVIAQLL